LSSKDQGGPGGKGAGAGEHGFRDPQEGEASAAHLRADPPDGRAALTYL
jgi:hypothetical protein